MTYRTIGCKVWFDWDFNGVYTEETSNLVEASGEMRLSPAEQSISGSQGMVDQCTIELRNASGRYSPLNTSGALYAYTQNGGAYHVPMYVETMIDGSTYTRLFTGVTKLPRETGKTWDGIPTVRFDCRSNDELYLQKRMSTTQTGLVQRNEDGFTEGQIIDAFLTAAGATPLDIEYGLVTLPWSYMDDESVIEEVWAIAAASLGRFYTNADGDFVYENSFHWLTAPHVTSQQTYTNADWQRLEAFYDDTDLYDTVTVEYSGREPDAVGLLWEPDDPVQVPAGATINMVANYSQGAFSIVGVTYKAHSNGGVDLTSDVTVNVTYSAQRAAVQIVNANATLAATVFPLQITGRPLRGGPSAEETRDSTTHGTNATYFASRGSRTRSVRGNFYIQTRAQAGMVAQFLLDRHEHPRLVYRMTGALGDAERRPGDRITVNDTSVMSSGREAYVMAVSWRYGGMSYTQDIEAVDAANLFRGYGVNDPFFIIGTNKLNAALGDTAGKCWY
jgi:hypothetical protein